MESVTNTKNKAVFESKAQTTVVEPSSRAVLMILIGLMICGTAIRLYGIELRGFYDEAASWTFARLNWTNFWKVMWDYEGNMVFYYILLKGWLFFGDTEIAVRGLSVVVGVLSIPMLYLLGKRLFDRRVGILSAGFLVFHAFHIEWSQQARSYVVVLLLLLISTYLLVAAIESKEPAKFWIGYVLIGALACYCQLFAALALVSHWIFIGPGMLKQLGSRRVLSVWGALALLTAPAAAFVIFQNKGQLEWVPSLTWNYLSRFLHKIAGSSGNGLLILFALMSVVAIATLFSKHTRMNERRNLRLLLLWLVTPVAVLLLLSLRKNMFVDRFLLMCLPALLLLVAFGTTILSELVHSRRLIPGIAITLVFGMSLSADFTQYKALANTKNNWRAMTQEILSKQKTGDAAIFFTAASSLSFQYYANLLNRERNDAYTPTIVIPHFGNTPSGANRIPSREEIRTAVTGKERVWLVLNTGSISLVPSRKEAVPIIRKTLEEQFEVRVEQTLSGTPSFFIALYERKRSSNHF